ncbi:MULTISPECIES: tRNA pseudouridine(38-40) synthase TruA [Saccharopolyspora]|uniref:tRNA pseudouridine synthase A n=1 Tax=Saccharopolyspora TaxID=1835 RepID=UPI001CD44AAE|nr:MULTISPECIES: tRNA pseudouridine synthase A [unclassified Saccharopolyspora]MCA1186381.1 tRNA pseudouridine synthase A [Saccharopolyspora sp. 6T]MCA1191160.1 tRNA pseudouridine synthase A [Saccharopolyspora sp. 6V]MCA1225710.1 tRNA pseudouridine synthase A [Saccharopolyspora sp. 6M]MCA1278578.1 tRNA pseudouridine synthase A [Saccharopolyspora sp. 7B]
MDVSYEGTDFSGWAKQPGRRTVQGLLEDALAKQPPGRDVPRSVVVAGRTDAGVHATGQVVHVDVVPFEPGSTVRIPVDERGIPDLERMRHRWNRILPGDVRVLDARVAPAGFDARFSALRRHYRYQVSDASWGVDPLRRRDTLAWNRPVDVAALNAASLDLLGLRDFAAFCKPREGATTVRELQRFEWERVAEHLIVARVSADAFCHSMVRSLVGALLLVGDGRRGGGWPAELAGAGERTSAVAPAHGLTLLGVDYPDEAELAVRAEQTRGLRSLG